MSDKLKIYACSGIGSAEQEEGTPLQFWTDGTNTISNTQAVNSLLAKINLLHIEANKERNLSEQDRIEAMKMVDLYSVALEAAKHYATDAEGLHRAGEVIAHMDNEGAFDYNETDAQKREQHLEDLIDKFYAIHNDDEPLANINPDWMDWWKANVEDLNKVGLNFGQQQNARKALKKAVAGIGAIDPAWKENDDISNYLLNGGTYFLYTYFTDAQLNKLPAVFKARRANQMKIYNYCKSFFVDVYGSESEMQSIIRSSIVDQFGAQPENVCADIVSGKRSVNGIGFLFGAATAAEGIKLLIELLAVIGAVLVGIVTAICQCVYKSNASKYGSLNQQVIDNGCPDETDYSELEAGLSGGKSSWITAAAIGAGLLLLLKN